MRLTIVYDNYPYRSGLETDWGFSALVQSGPDTVLFDTGKRGSILLSNLKALDCDLGSIDAVVLSHAHSDHSGGMQALLDQGIQPDVYLLPSFSAGYKARLRRRTAVREVEPAQQIAPRIYTTGEIAGSPPEQALVLDTPRGLVIITGCAHPGIVSMVEAAKRTFHERPYLVAGGFHLGSAGPARLKTIMNEFRRLDVKYVAPCHCSGDNARWYFSREFGKDYIEAGVGKVIDLMP